MKDISVPIGNSDFREIREEGYYYIDKTGLIEELLHKQGTKITRSPVRGASENLWE